VDAVVSKVGAKRITNSKDLRKLRAILPDPVAKAHFLSEEGDLDSAILRLAPAARREKGGLAGDLEATVESLTPTTSTQAPLTRGWLSNSIGLI
jgi:ParB family chromosome partitioning protein